jgi:hypothetical protein
MIIDNWATFLIWFGIIALAVAYIVAGRLTYGLWNSECFNREKDWQELLNEHDQSRPQT